MGKVEEEKSRLQLIENPSQYTVHLLSQVIPIWKYFQENELVKMTEYLTHNIRFGRVTVYPAPFIEGVPDTQYIALVDNQQKPEAKLMTDAEKYVFYNFDSQNRDLVIADDLFTLSSPTIQKGILYAAASTQIFPLIFELLPRGSFSSAVEMIARSTGWRVESENDVVLARQKFLRHLFLQNKYATSVFGWNYEDSLVCARIIDRIDNLQIAGQIGNTLNEIYPRMISLVTHQILDDQLKYGGDVKNSVKRFEKALKWKNIQGEKSMFEYVKKMHPDEPNVAWCLYTLIQQTEEAGQSWLRLLELFRSGEITELNRFFFTVEKGTRKERYRHTRNDFHEGDLMIRFLKMMRIAFALDDYIVHYPKDFQRTSLKVPSW